MAAIFRFIPGCLLKANNKSCCLVLPGFIPGCTFTAKLNIAMFDYQKLRVYQKAKELVRQIGLFMDAEKLDRTVHDQLRRASLSIVLNIAEGSSRISHKDRRNFLIIARGSLFECLAIFEILHLENKITTGVFDQFSLQMEEISRMLWGLIKRTDLRQ